MNFQLLHIHVLAAGLLVTVMIGFIIKKQNNILTQDDSKNGFVSYNHAASKEEADELVKKWRNNPIYFQAVKNIIFTDYVWMIFFGATIFYGLSIGFNYAAGERKLIFAAGMVLLTVAVSIDFLQDTAIYRHLTKNIVADLRFLTTTKFILLGVAIVTATSGIVLYRSHLLHESFWQWE